MTITDYGLLFLALAAGFGVAWFWATSRERSQHAGRERQLEGAAASHQGAATELRKQIENFRTETEVNRKRIEAEQVLRAAAQTELENFRTQLEQERKLLEEAKTKLSDAFKSLAAEALKSNQSQFLELAKTKFETLSTEAAGELGKREEAVKQLVEPISTSLERLRSAVTQLETGRGELRGQLDELSKTNSELRKETGALATSLRQPQIKGKWGELTLRRAVELAGMSPHCDFVEKPSTETEEGRLQPDLVVQLPGGNQIVVDAKVPNEAFLKAISASTEADYRQAMEEHGRIVRNHVAQLAAKTYWEHFQPTPEFVVCFFPAESFFSAALEQEPQLIEEAIEKKVVLASPTHLIALLRAVAYGWRQRQVAENAEQIRELGKELYDRLVKFAEHLTSVGTGLGKAVEAYNNAVGSLETRLVPSARKLQQLGVTAEEELPAVEQIETMPRPLALFPSEDDR